MQSIDGVRKTSVRPVTKRVTKIVTPVARKAKPALSFAPKTSIASQTFAQQPVAQIPQAPKPSGKHIGLLGFFNPKQIATIAITFIITFVLSIATSQTLASYGNTDPSQNPNLAQAQNAGASDDSDLSVVAIPNLNSFNDTVLDQPGDVFLPAENIALPNPLKERQEFLQKYLSAKGSPLADHVEALSEQSQWKLIIAISRAESSFCKHKENYNCWGIGGAWDLKQYSSFDEAVADVNRILEQHYIQAGLNTPGEIVKKYVGHQNDNWEEAVQEELDNLKDVQ